MIHAYKKFSLILFILMVLGVCFTAIEPAVAQTSTTLAQQEKTWLGELNRIESEVEDSGSVKLDKRNKWQETLDRLRREAKQLADETQDTLDSEQAVLSALGAAPEKPEDEAASVRRQREKLNKEITKIDAELKRANLVIARADEIKALIDSREKAEAKSRLFSKTLMLVNPENWPVITQQAGAFSVSFDQWQSFVFLLFGLVVILGLSFPITRYLNHFFDKAPHIKLIKPFSRRRLLLMMAAAYVVFLMRIGELNLGEFTALEDTLQAIASICLALVLFGALGKFEFVDSRTHSDRLGEQKRSYHGMFNGMKRLVRLVLMLLPIASVVGYVNLTLYLSFNVALTFAAIMLFMWLRNQAVKISCKLTPECDVPKEDLSPLAVSIIEPILALFSLSLILFFWGMTTEDIAGWLSELQNGITIGDLTIDFISIGSAIAMLFVLWFATKVFQWFLSNRVFQYTKLDSGIQDAIIAITGYVGIIIALLVAMGAIGLNMQNFAIVAGALSVGIGFGLQAIFNNFVSGLILLFERPVKVGDWVVVGEFQGIIKKIRVRSTEIETFWNSSVIVPNSQLISDTVTNWTLHDRAGRVDIKVGVAYGSDTEKVKDVLMAVAKEHKEVRDYPETRVIFAGFGDSSLDFELRCFINNIRDVFIVGSELRFAVDKAFRENNIEIPFPQRDLHIKSADSPIKVESND